MDFSNYLIHLVNARKDREDTGNLKILQDIIIQGKITANEQHIGFKCVCFTESPAKLLPSKFTCRPFGFMFSKAYVFGKGGRHVINQSKDELKLLDKKIYWKHKTYEPENILILHGRENGD